MAALGTPPALLVDFTRRGFTLRAVAGRLAVSPAAGLTANDRDTLREHRLKLLAFLSPAEPWNQEVAVRLIYDADTLVEQSGVSGRHPAVVEAAAMVTSAFALRDLETLRLAVAEFAVLIRQLARERIPAEVSRQPLGESSGEGLADVSHRREPQSAGSANGESC
jgi:hypothetical protein